MEEHRTYCIHQMETFYTRDLIDKIFQITDQLQKINLTFEMIVILKAACIFFPGKKGNSFYADCFEELVKYSVIVDWTIVLNNSI